jgi:hypothetical protein
MAKNEQEAHVRGVAPAGLDDAELDEHGLTVLKVSQKDSADPDPRHAGPEKLGLQGVPFDPNAALRKKMGVGPGLQDSEALRPAVWVDENSDEARKASADALEFDAQRALDRAKAEADAIRKGEPF